MKSVTYDETKYVLVPFIPTQDMINDARQYSALSHATFEGRYNAYISARPDDLPGVVMDTGEPVAWLHHTSVGNLIFHSASYVRDYNVDTACMQPLFTHPAPDAIAIVKAALEAAEKIVTDLGDRADDSGTWVYVDAIHAISPQSVLDGLNK